MDLLLKIFAIIWMLPKVIGVVIFLLFILCSVIAGIDHLIKKYL